MHEAHTLAGAGFGSIAGDVVNQRHRRAKFFHGHEDGHVEFDFGGSGLVGTIVDRRERVEICILQMADDLPVEGFIADEVREPAGRDDGDPLVAVPRPESIEQRFAELNAARHGGLGRRVERIHQNRHAGRADRP